MPTLEAIRAALEKFVSAGAGEAEHRLIGQALRAGRLVLAEGERSVALGGGTAARPSSLATWCCRWMPRSRASCGRLWVR